MRGGRTRAHAHARARAQNARLYADAAPLLLRAHAGTSSVSICHMLGFPPTPWEWERLVIGHATVNRLELFEIGDGMTFGLSQLSGNDTQN